MNDFFPDLNVHSYNFEIIFENDLICYYITYRLLTYEVAAHLRCIAFFIYFFSKLVVYFIRNIILFTINHS